MLGKIINETKNAIVAAIVGADDILTALRTAVKNQIKGTITDVSDVGVSGENAVSAIVIGGLRSATDTGQAFIEVTKNTVSAVASTADPPEPVRGLVAVQAGEDSVRLTWRAVNVTGAPVVKYRVYVSDQPIEDLSDPSVVWTGNVTATAEPTHLVTDLALGTTYYFAVVTEDDRGRTSNGAPQVASVSIPVPREERPGVWEEWGPTVTVVLLFLLVVLVIYVLVSRQRRYGRILSRRPSWERNGNGGKER